MNKLKAELRDQKQENKQKQVEIDELVARIKLMGDSDRVIRELKMQFEEKTNIIVTLRAQID